MEELTDFLSNDLIASSIHMATINIDVLIYIKRISEIMNPIEMLFGFNFQDKGVDRMKIRFSASFLQIFNVGMA